MASLEEIREERLRKRDRLQAAKEHPYPVAPRRDRTIAEVRAAFGDVVASGVSLAIAGRVMALRGQGGLLFVDLSDGTGHFQGMLRKDEMDPDRFALFADNVDLGDFVRLEGALALSKRGEETIMVADWGMLGKTLRPMPDKWHGLTDVEEKFRKRYLDILSSDESRARFLLRSRVVTEIRALLNEAGYLEVETPMMQPIPGGTNAEPFKTHHNALDIDLFLRIAPELYLKRLLVGGFPKVYELARNFRNEGIDLTHNPEFTMLEFYEAYADATSQMAFVESMLRELAARVFGVPECMHEGTLIDFGKPFAVVPFLSLFDEYAGIKDIGKKSREELAAIARDAGASVAPGDTREKMLDVIYKKLCRPKIMQPTYLVDYPIGYLPLAKRKTSDPEIADAFQLVVAGVELVKGYSELNDPIDQRSRFDAQEAARAAGDAEAQQLDEEFLEALEYGMPPAGGVGIGIDRLVMLLSDTRNIRDVVLFPTLRPRG
ncbi:MAG TPA: lysine--tRNA ligase [Candidatus Paceibacterota bacterium]|nr:lysine--tRNA ligase [Candidatus Paceibacterota bacterium]